MFMSHVELVDVRTERERLARALGVEFATPDTARHDRDLVLHASGRAEGLQAALKLSAPEATLIELSWYGSDLVALALGEDFHVKRLTLRSSQVGSVSPNARPRFAHRSRLEYALSLCGDEVLDCLFTSQASFEILPESMRELATGEGAPLCHRVHYGAK
jgi:threonine dehydrogenase-like Zn-dependent dehydrogenase